MAQKLMFQEINATQIKAKFQYYEGLTSYMKVFRHKGMGAKDYDFTPFTSSLFNVFMAS